ncbi:hypothetical protein MAPG_02262 [Magnaporthiopsis poae ATCC 64411]|uniref:Uncharacterized protein n=1 Tax=Magnaporthiopsis poae (strain ATCC 64411 / 73-15) TaxID=644358 RepID=A0A0C4DQW4_MAGP6|nr:hypothetical protein MAPG_02262 [Magnaporthiopsis poae ATCC 64411]
MDAIETFQSWARQARALLVEQQEKHPIEIHSPPDVYKSPYVIAVVVAILGGLVLAYALLGENDKPRRYTVPPAKMPDKEEILDQPSLKIMC